MTTLERALDEILDDPLRGLPDGVPAIGHVGTDVPMDMLLATGRPVAHLPWRLDRPTPRAEDWLESRFPRWAFSILEDWAAGRFDGFGQVVFSRGNDVAQRLYYYVCELQRRDKLGGPTPLIFDVAYIPRDSSYRYTKSALLRLASRLGVDAAALRLGIEHTNRRRARFARLEAEDSVCGALLSKLARASLFTDVGPLLDAHPPAVAGPQRRRVLLAGSIPPAERLHNAVATAGGSVVAEWHEGAIARWGRSVESTDADPFAALARQVRELPLGPRAFGEAAARVVDYAQRRRAQAVVFWLSEDDDARGWQVPVQREAFSRAGLPSLVMTARAGDAGDGAVQEIEAFVGGLST